MTADSIRHAADGVQWLALVTAVLLLLMVLAAGWHWPGWRKPLALVIVYGVLATAFYVATLANLVPAPWTSLLSSLLRLYAHVLMVAVAGGVIFVALADEKIHGDAGVEDDS